MYTINKILLLEANYQYIPNVTLLALLPDKPFTTSLLSEHIPFKHSIELIIIDTYKKILFFLIFLIYFINIVSRFIESK